MASSSSSSSKPRGGFRIRHLLHLKKPVPDPSRNPLIPTPRVVPTRTTFASTLRGLGCASSADASSPAAAAAAAAAAGSSEEWRGRRSRRKLSAAAATRKRRAHPNHHRDDLVADVSDVWCAPGVVFGADPPVDCVVAHRPRDARAHAHRENRRGGGSSEVMRLASLLESSSAIGTPLFGSGAMRSGHLNHARGIRPSPVDFDHAMMMFQARVLGGMDLHDQYRDLRLDVDSMSYEELLELSDKIGYVSTGLREEEISRNLRKTKHTFFNLSPLQNGAKCIICQEEYEGNDDTGRLECGHSYHIFCIKQWLLQKNACPVCKTEMARS